MIARQILLLAVLLKLVELLRCDELGYELVHRRRCLFPLAELLLLLLLFLLPELVALLREG